MFVLKVPLNANEPTH